ncbi:hypothetical protein C8J57DRAFT_1221032 [Mycena rebaudengoi]|nr:hypothetical protein C8J57DRAFT_1221032 [Mycena rebaudengoi]
MPHHRPNTKKSQLYHFIRALKGKKKKRKAEPPTLPGANTTHDPAQDDPAQPQAGRAHEPGVELTCHGATDARSAARDASRDATEGIFRHARAEWCPAAGWVAMYHGATDARSAAYGRIDGAPSTTHRRTDGELTRSAGARRRRRTRSRKRSACAEEPPPADGTSSRTPPRRGELTNRVQRRAPPDAPGGEEEKKNECAWCNATGDAATGRDDPARPQAGRAHEPGVRLARRQRTTAYGARSPVHARTDVELIAAMPEMRPAYALVAGRPRALPLPRPRAAAGAPAPRACEANARRFGDGRRVFVLFGVAVGVAVNAAVVCGAGLVVALRGIGKGERTISLRMCLCLSRPETAYVDRAGEVVKFVLFSRSR